MKLLRCMLAGIVLCASGWAQQTQSGNGMPRLHDPSTIVRDGAMYYVFETGRGVPFFSSPDLHTWTRRGKVFDALPQTLVQLVPGNDGQDAWAPDVIKLGETFYLYYAVSSWGKFASAIGLATNTTLDPANPAYRWVDRGVVTRSDGVQDMNAIDPGVILTSGGELWLCFGSYHGTIDLIQLDRQTGLALKPKAPPDRIASARGSEAADIIEHAGWFYLFVNHGSCCKGAQSTYHINVGRSRKVTGPYVDRAGKSLMDAPGEAFAATDGAHIGPGHFGLVPAIADKIERFSLHYESDPEHDGHSALAIRKLSWTADGWPVAGELDAGTAAK